MMEVDDYFFLKLEKLPSSKKKLADEMVKVLHEWAPVNKVAEYLQRDPTTIYRKIRGRELYAKKISNRILVYTRSIVLLLEDID